MMGDKKDVYVIDFFCGMAGFSEGAKQAGAKVVLAIDNWKSALEVHKNNHTETVHWDLTLGSNVYEFSKKLNDFIEENVPKGGHLHIHGSPPCQNLSIANNKRVEKEGEILIDWYIDLVKHTKRMNTWSMEQVRCSYTKQLLDNHGGCLIEMRKFGVHNNRKRIFLGNFTDFTRDDGNFSKPLTLYEIMVLCGENIPEGFTYQSNGSKCKKKKGYLYKEIDLLSCTVTGQYPKLYNKTTFVHKSLGLNILSYLQTFPIGYISNDHNKGEGRQMIGNSIPPQISKLLIENLK